MTRAEFSGRYVALFATALEREPTRGTHVNVLEHALGYFRGAVEPVIYSELRQAIARYAAGEVDLGVPIERLAREIANGGMDYLAQQRYFDAFNA
jgi:uncharacterized protein YbgA (DUF1722 family)